MKGSRKAWLALSAVTIAAVAAGCGSSSSGGGGGGGGGQSAGKHPKTIAIGATLPLTGSGAPFGQLFEDAMKIAVDRINATGGVNGAKMTATFVDDQALAAPAVMATTQLIKQNNALVVATAYNDPPLAQFKVGQRYGVPIMNGGGNDPAMLNKPYLWTNSSILTAEAKPAFEYAKAHGVKKVGILAASNYTNYDINVYRQLANQVFGGTQPLVTFDPNSSNVTSQLQQLQSQHVDAISPLSSGTLTLTVAKDMSQLGMKDTVLGTGATLTEPPEIVKQPAWMGAIAAVIAETPPPWLTAAVQAHEKTAANAYHVFFANIPYIVKDAVQALEAQGKDVSGSNINALFEQYAQQGKSFQGAGGPVTYKPDHTVSHAYTISKNVSGTFKVLSTVPAGQ
jgi:ABC-type branched-subunit amino acid transport system substrate-binding protein